MHADSGSSGTSSSSSSDSDEGSREHPMEAAVRRRAAAHAAAAADASPPAKPPVKSSSPESGELPGSASAGADRQPLHQTAKHSKRSSPAVRAQQAAPAADDLDIDAEAASDSSSEGGSSASGSDSEEELGGGRTEPAVPAPAPAGVIVVESAEQRNAEVQRLLRAPRYFDEDFEEAGLRCFKCGGKGHFARDCTAEARERSCFLCAQFGHDSRDCPNSLCWRCQRPGHMARDCPYGYRQQASWDEAGPAVCLRCGSETCPCAGEKDFVRADGGCKREYSERDLRHARCYSCGKRGHLSCAAAPTEPAALSCHNCGQGGHSAAECSRELPQVIRGEMAGSSHRGSFDRGGGGGGYSSGGYASGGGYRQQQGGYGSRQPRYAAYSAYGDIEQPHRRRSYDEAFDRDGYGYGRQYGGGGGGGGDWGGGKRPRR